MSAEMRRKARPWQRDPPMLHQLFRLSVQTNHVHRVLRVVSVLLFEFRSVNIFLPFLPEQSFQLVVRKPQKRFYMPLRKKDLGPSHTLVPRLCSELQRREQKM